MKIMNKILNSTFENARITLDNMHYEKCKFNNCTIEFSGIGKLGLIDCDFNNCEWVFVGPAQNTLAFLGTMYHSFGDFGEKMIEATFQNIKNKKQNDKLEKPEN